MTTTITALSSNGGTTVLLGIACCCNHILQKMHSEVYESKKRPDGFLSVDRLILMKRHDLQACTVR
jgi:hypothetical protein